MYDGNLKMSALTENCNHPGFIRKVADYFGQEHFGEAGRNTKDALYGLADVMEAQSKMIDGLAAVCGVCAGSIRHTLREHYFDSVIADEFNKVAAALQNAEDEANRRKANPTDE